MRTFTIDPLQRCQAELAKLIATGDSRGIAENIADTLFAYRNKSNLEETLSLLRVYLETLPPQNARGEKVIGEIDREIGARMRMLRTPP